MPLHLTTRDASPHKGFTLTELLVSVAIILVLVSLIGAGVSAARGSTKRQATQALIAKLDAIIQQQYSTYASRTVISATSSAMRAAALRQIASGDMPDNWVDVALLATGSTSLVSSGTTYFPLNATQRAYKAIWTNFTAAQKTSVPTTNGDAECLFMIVMQGGIANCLDCGELKTADKGDTDGDGAFEFLDAWGNPIRFVLWPAKLQLPSASSTLFFSTSPPFSSGATGRLMRPLIFSCGPDGSAASNANPSLITSSTSSTANLASGTSCGDPSTISFAGPNPAATESAADNLTNFDAEAAQ